MKGLRMTPEAFSKMMENNPHVKLNDTFQTNPQPKPERKSVVDLEKVCESIKQAKMRFEYNERSLILILDGARVLSLNQMFSLYQQKSGHNQPYKMIYYKKVWEEKMKALLEALLLDSIENEKPLPQFDGAVKLFLFRQSAKLLDEDNYSASFKFMIDGLRRETVLFHRQYQVLKDDSKHFVSSVSSCQVKDKHNIIAIKLVKDEQANQKWFTGLEDLFLVE